jgi:hypothetical protein
MTPQLKEFIEGRYKEQVEWYSGRASKNKTFYTVFQWITVGFSSAVPAMVIGIPQDYKWITASISVIVAIGTSAIKTFKYQEIWLNYRTISETLKKEHVFFTHLLGDYAKADDAGRMFIERIETLISRENSLWVISMTDEEKVEKK